MKTFKALIKPFEASQRSVKVTSYFNFLSSFGIQTGWVKNKELQADALIFLFQFVLAFYKTCY